MHPRPLLATPLVSLWDWRCDGRDSSCEERMHAGFEIVLVRRGAFVRQSESADSVADATVAGFWSPHEAFRIRHLTAAADDCTIIRFARCGVQQMFEMAAPAANDRALLRFPRTHGSVASDVYLAHLRLLRDIEAGRTTVEAEERTVNLVMRLFTDAFGARRERCATGRARARAREYAARVREFVAAHFLEPLTLDRIAREVCCSPFHLSRMMIAAEGVRIHELVVRLRLREAARALLDTRDAISAIALRTGFSSHSHFGAAFRREFGTTPGAARRRGRAFGGPAHA
jgi:AraC-like DNA-binding protein